MIFWIDKNLKQYYKNEIDDKYLMNIAKALTRGVGNIDFCTQGDVVSNIFEECFNRGLLTAEKAHKMEEDALDAFERREICEWARLRSEIEFEEHAYGTD